MIVPLLDRHARTRIEFLGSCAIATPCLRVFMPLHEDTTLEALLDVVCLNTAIFLSTNDNVSPTNPAEYAAVPSYAAPTRPYVNHPTQPHDVNDSVVQFHIRAHAEFVVRLRYATNMFRVSDDDKLKPGNAEVLEVPRLL